MTTDSYKNIERLERVFRMVLALVCAACTYGPPEPLVRVANHTTRPGTDSIAIAVYAARMERPTGIAAFPDGGRARFSHELGVLFLCVAPKVGPITFNRIAVLRRPDSLLTAFTPWVGAWDGSGRVQLSLRGYTSAESTAAAHRVVWYEVDLAGTVRPLTVEPSPLGVSTSLPRACEAQVLGDARELL